jgi:hypothetical protein
MLPFWLSIGMLSLVQGAIVAAPGARAVGMLEPLRSRAWALIPPLSVLAFVLVARVAEHDSSQALTYLALVAVPPLAALALGWLVWDARPPRPALGLLVAPLFALAWADRGGFAGQAAAVALAALSCVTLGVVLAAVTPARWLALGIVAMALADSALVISDLLQHPNAVLDAAHPAAGLPRLQSAALGSAVMGYGDLFVAGALGGLLAVRRDRRRQWCAALLAGGVALGFDVLFLFVDELPATVPIALVVLLLGLVRGDRGVRTGAGSTPAGSPLAAGGAEERRRTLVAVLGKVIR